MWQETLDSLRGIPMTNAIQQSARFAAPPHALFEMYLDSKKHSAATGGKATMSRKLGGAFTAWNNQLRGRNLLIVADQLIVQSWRSVNFKKGDLDSDPAIQQGPGRRAG